MRLLKNIKDTIWKRADYIVYTIRHKQAFLQVEKQLRGKNTLGGYLHDLDKVILYMIPGLDIDTTVQKFHREHSKHHVEYKGTRTDKDRLDAIIDWECAPITKPDKPLRAYETLLKFYRNYVDEFLPLIQQYLPKQIEDYNAKMSSNGSNTITKHTGENSNTSESVLQKTPQVLSASSNKPKGNKIASQSNQFMRHNKQEHIRE